MIDLVIHAFLELTGQGVWACIRGRCKHKSHRFCGDALFLLLVAYVTVHLIG